MLWWRSTIRWPTRSYATWTHQDDMETPLVADDLGGLCDLIGDWADCGWENCKSQGDLVTVDGTPWRIVREVVTAHSLTADELRELSPEIKTGHSGC